LKCSPLSVVLPDSRGKHYLLNVMDTPGHPGFSDEVTAAFRIADGALLVVDCIEGVTYFTEKLIKEALRTHLRIVVVLNKIDRLVLELKLPPTDAYYKIKHTLDDINVVIQKYSNLFGGDGNKQQLISPLNSNVIFMSTQFGCAFTVQSFAKRYAENLAILGGQNKNGK